MHLSDAQEDNLLTVLTSAFLNMKQDLAALILKPDEEKKDVNGGINP
jgi:hypothetical protein